MVHGSDSEGVFGSQVEKCQPFTDLTFRQHYNDILTIVSLMQDTGMPCFRPATMEHLRQRFVPDKTEKAAAQHMTKQIVNAFGNIASFATYFYDLFQHYTQGIDM